MKFRRSKSDKNKRIEFKKLENKNKFYESGLIPMPNTLEGTIS